MAVTVSVFWPGIIAFLILLGLFLTGLVFYARSKQSRSPLLWIVGIVVCVVVAYVIATFVVEWF
jgi:high-affinity Fe2+/Pb2+ permease